MKKYKGPAKALKRVGSVAECHTEDYEDVAESRVVTTRRTGFWRTLGHQRAKRTSTGNICGFANASGGRMLIGVSGDRNRRADNTLAFAKKGDAVRGHRSDPPRAGVRAG